MEDKVIDSDMFESEKKLEPVESQQEEPIKPI